MAEIGKWMPERDDRRTRPWTVARKNGARGLTCYRETLTTMAGDVRRFGSREAAQKLCDELNGANRMRGKQ